jgi:hypothetical protein
VAISPDGRHTVSQFTATVCAAGAIAGSHSRRLVPILHGDLLFVVYECLQRAGLDRQQDLERLAHMIIRSRIGL